MKAIMLQGNGRPEEVCTCVDVADPGAPDAGELLVDMLASAINPADLLIFEGRYPGPGEFPAPVGIEGVGRVAALGEGVEGFAVGDLVLSMGRANWAQQVRAPAATFVALPGDLDLRHAAMLKANPPSAHLMLETYVDLQPGDWVIQNAANSAVGRHLIAMARARGVRTANVVRRPELVDELKRLGADVVLVDGDDLAARLRDEIGADARLPLAIDAIGGHACLRLAECLSDGGTVVNYGFLSGEPCMITPYQAIVRGISLTGFWLVGFMRSAARDEIEALYARMAQLFKDGVLDVPVEAEYPLDEIAAALAHAGRAGRDGKVILRLT